MVPIVVVVDSLEVFESIDGVDVPSAMLVELWTFDVVLDAAASTMLELKTELDEVRPTDGVAVAVVISFCDVGRRSEVAALV